MENVISPDILSKLSINADRDIYAACLKIEIAQKAIDEDHIEASYNLLLEGLTFLETLLQQDQKEIDILFMSNALLFADACLYLGTNHETAYKFAKKALEISKYLGDRRSQAVLELHIGVLLYYGDRKLEALKYLAAGKEAVDLLDDDDIKTQTYEFFGFYYYLRGLHKEALEFSEKAIYEYENNARTQFIFSVSPVLFGLSAAHLGQFHRAIGMLDYFLHRVLSEGKVSLAYIYRSTMGLVLLMTGKKQEALWHIEGTLRDIIKGSYALARYMSYTALAYYRFLNKEYKEARSILEDMYIEGQSAGPKHRYASPYVIEMLYELEMNGCDSIPGFSFAEQVELVMKEPSVHLKGVALRLKAKEAMFHGENIQVIESYLNDSLENLQLSGDPMQLAKTKIELATLKLKEGYSKEAQKLSQEARKGLSGISDELYPAGLRSLLQSMSPQNATSVIDEKFLLSQLDMILKSPISPIFEETLTSLISQMTHLLGAERSGFFWLNNENSKEIKLLASRNLHKNDIISPNFNPSMKIIWKTFRTRRPEKRKNEYSNFTLTSRVAFHMLAIPIKIDAEVRGVLYFDNSYLLECLDKITDHLLSLISEKLSIWVEQVENVSKLMEQKIRVIKEEAVQRELSGKADFIIGKSHPMTRIIEAVDKVALTDSPVLIDGETGAGKELVARRIHDKSYRSKKPLVILDLTAIPENLIESELFGYEKGAFTGAGTRKSGRIEQAHEGTLYIDEIGEVPKPLQVKLLRVLQDRTFTRIGGARQLESDFRLIAATNRDLKEEVAAGRFREDLYYRLSTVNITVPPLRKRPEDIVPLANYFLARFVKRYNRPNIKLSHSDEEKLINYSWPGNVRELNNVIERAAILSEKDNLELSIPALSKSSTMKWFDLNLTRDDLERRYICHILDQTGGRIAGSGGAAEILGMDRSTLRSRMKKLGIARM